MTSQATGSSGHQNIRAIHTDLFNTQVFALDLGVSGHLQCHCQISGGVENLMNSKGLKFFHTMHFDHDFPSPNFSHILPISLPTHSPKTK